MKRLTNQLHLLAGVALLAMGAYFFRQTTRSGKMLLQEFSSEHSVTTGDSFVPRTAKEKVYGVLGQTDEAASGDNDVPAQTGASASSLDHVNAIDAGAPNHFLHRRVTVDTYQTFAFEVPPRAIRPELRGTFRPVATRRNTSGIPSVELLLMNEEEFDRFVNHRPVTATFSSAPSSHGEIRWQLNANRDNPQKYYFVFRNSLTGQGPSIVDADFTASFE